MLVDQVVTHLEMTSPDQLRPATPVTAIALEQVADVSLVRSTHDRIGAPHHWSSLRWTDRQWNAWMAAPGLRHWLIRAGNAVAGLSSLQADPQRGEVEISIFGLVPEFVGRGYGGHALTVTTRLAWNHEDAHVVFRVRLHTSSLDHQHALTNYRSRGFRPFRTETRQREIPY